MRERYALGAAAACLRSAASASASKKAVEYRGTRLADAVAVEVVQRAVHALADDAVRDVAAAAVVAEVVLARAVVADVRVEPRLVGTWSHV